MQTYMSYHIAILYNKTLKKDLQKKKSVQQSKKCVAKDLQNEKNCASAGFEPASVSTTTSGSSTVYPVVCNGMQLNFYLHHHQQAIADKRNRLEACNKLSEEARW